LPTLTAGGCTVIVTFSRRCEEYVNTT